MSRKEREVEECGVRMMGAGRVGGIPRSRWEKFGGLDQGICCGGGNKGWP